MLSPQIAVVLLFDICQKCYEPTQNFSGKHPVHWCPPRKGISPSLPCTWLQIHQWDWHLTAFRDSLASQLVWGGLAIDNTLYLRRWCPIHDQINVKENLWNAVISVCIAASTEEEKKMPITTCSCKLDPLATQRSFPKEKKVPKWAGNRSARLYPIVVGADLS